MKRKVATLTVRKWGNSLAVRIPASIARNAHFYTGTSVELSVKENGVMITMAGEVKLTLAERLKRFDPKKHSGEVMAVKPVGLEE